MSERIAYDDITGTLRTKPRGSQDVPLLQDADGTLHAIDKDGGRVPFANTKWLARGLDYYWEGRTWDTGGPGAVGVGQQSIKASEVWRGAVFNALGVAVDGSLSPPATYNGRGVYAVGLYSKRFYNWLIVRCRLPLLPVNNQSCWLGFEDDYQLGGASLLQYTRNGGVPYLLRAWVGSMFLTSAPEIQAFLPGVWPDDYQNNLHVYAIGVFKSRSEVWIDSILRAVILNNTPTAAAIINGPPYTIIYSPSPFSTRMSALLECHNREVTLNWAVNPSEVRIQNTDPHPPRTYRMYRTGTGTLLAGYTIPAPGPTTEISHPVPVLGYDVKTILFQATTAGTLDILIQSQSNNWRTYHSVPVVANTLLDYQMFGRNVNMRVDFTPTVYPSTISDAEVTMSGG